MYIRRAVVFDLSAIIPIWFDQLKIVAIHIAFVLEYSDAIS